MGSHTKMSKESISEYLTVSDGQNIYFEAEVEGEIPVLLFHGGWGPLNHDGAFLDKKTFRKIYLHQRGWDKSGPASSMKSNSRERILKDCEEIRQKLNIDKWIVTGGSTGAMLAFAYGTEYPERCLGVLLRGLWLLSPNELDFNYQSPFGKALFYPSDWAKLLANGGLSREQGDQVVATYNKLVRDENKTIAAKAARAWLAWDCLGSTVLSSEPLDMIDEVAIDTAKIGLELYTQSMEMEDLLFDKGTKVLAETGVKVRLVVGRLDMLCPPGWSQNVTDKICELGGDAVCNIVDGAAHSELDPGMEDAMKKAIDDML